MIRIEPNIRIYASELAFTFICSPGPGGQNVNKVASGVQLRFNVTSSTLPEDVKKRLFLLLEKRITSKGDLIIKATRHRTQILNKQDALERLEKLLKRAAFPPKNRRKTKPTKSSVESRLASKKQHAKNKSLRKSIHKNDH